MSNDVEKYYLCSREVVEHFPHLKKSLLFSSGYKLDGGDKYIVIATKDFKVIEKYYNKVILQG
jgi:hypothetical protein